MVTTFKKFCKELLDMNTITLKNSFRILAITCMGCLLHDKIML